MRCSHKGGGETQRLALEAEMVVMEVRAVKCVLV